MQKNNRSIELTEHEVEFLRRQKFDLEMMNNIKQKRKESDRNICRLEPAYETELDIVNDCLYRYTLESRNVNYILGR